MKNKLKSFFLILVIFLTFGCMDYKLNMSINNDKSVDFKMDATIDLIKYLQIYSDYLNRICTATCNNDQACIQECNAQNEIPSDEASLKNYISENVSEEEFNNIISEEDAKELEDKGFDVEINMDKNNLKYEVIISKKYANIDDITTTETKEINFNDILNDEIFYLKDNNTYKADYKIDTSTTTEDLDLDIDIEELNEFISMSYEIKLPTKPITHNATTTSRDGKTLTWDLTKTNSIKYEFKFEDQKENNTNNEQVQDNSKNNNILNNKYFAYGLIGGGVLLFIIGLIGLSKANKKG